MGNVYSFEEAAGILKVVAHPVRLSIIALLEGKSLKVGDVQSRMGIKQSVTSQHLNILANKGILGRKRNGNEVFYYIEKQEVLQILACIKNCCKN